MVKLKVITDNNNDETFSVIKNAISTEIKRLEISLKITEKEIKKFEDKYKVKSDDFLKKYTAENLDGKDEEYISWVGEIKFKDRIVSELSKLEEIEYETV